MFDKRIAKCAHTCRILTRNHTLYSHRLALLGRTLDEL